MRIYLLPLPSPHLPLLHAHTPYPHTPPTYITTKIHSILASFTREKSGWKYKVTQFAKSAKHKTDYREKALANLYTEKRTEENFWRRMERARIELQTTTSKTGKKEPTVWEKIGQRMWNAEQKAEFLQMQQHLIKCSKENTDWRIIPDMSSPDKTGDQEEQPNGRTKLYYPDYQELTGKKITAFLRMLAEDRQKVHLQRFIGLLVAAPLTFPFALIPV